jgi:O-antigen/teichoic acid export membrane protein
MSSNSALLVRAKAKGLVTRVRSSAFARDAALLFIFNASSKAAQFLGGAYAARCLGPSNLGISALVQTTAQQTTLLHYGGFDPVAVRHIAGNRGACAHLTGTIVSFRLIIASITSLIWITVIFLIKSPSQKWVWLMGAVILLTSASNLAFVFQGLGKLPIQNALNAGGSLLTALAFYFLFSPGMSLGADLYVICAVSLLSIAGSWFAYFRLFHRLPIGKVQWKEVKTLLGETWRYWILMSVTYVYSVFQIPLLAHFISNEELGVYRSALLLAGGVWLLFDSINALLLERLVVWRNIGLTMLWKRQIRLSAIFLLIGSVVGIPLIFGSSLIYRRLLGQAYIGGVTPFQILVIGRLVVFIGQIYAWGLAAVRQDTQFLVASILGAIASVVLIIMFVPRYGIVAAAMISVLSEVIVHLSCFLFLKRYIREELRNA